MFSLQWHHQWVLTGQIISNIDLKDITNNMRKSLDSWLIHTNDFILKGPVLKPIKQFCKCAIHMICGIELRC